MDIDVLVGLVMKDVRQSRDDYGGDELIFETESGRTFKFYHNQDCRESVTIEDICGILGDLIGAPITQAEEVACDDPPPDRTYLPESYTWTFYKFATAKGYVTVRWFGESNGYYSEQVDFTEVGAHQ